MAVRGEYTKAEEEMIAATNAKMDTMVGWLSSPNRIATEESMKNVALSVDMWNPLWNDEQYAAGTRWGGIIAFPMFQGNFGTIQLGPLEASPECGFQHMIWIGEDWEFFKPIHVNDSFKVWCKRPQLKDVTSLDGKGPRTFALFESDNEHINQKDELVSTSKLYVQRSFLPGPPKPSSMPEYGYTKEELLFIARMVREEEIRGADIRYWENVKVGEETKPVVLGPTSMADNAIASSAMARIDIAFRPRDLFMQAIGEELGDEFLLDPETGLYHIRGGPAGRHWADRSAQAEGEPCAFLFAVLSRYLMARLVTNWMGDDGFLRKYKWRHIARNAVGDTVIGRGKVVHKRVEDGEHLVDLKVWLENLRGNTTEVASATVSLCSKEAPFQWK
jgi:acyl dehydratase